MKKIYIKTFGCQMNVRDSEALLGLFLEQGYTSVDNPKEADVILLNTCSVRAHAEHRVRSILGALKKVTRSPGHKVTSKKAGDVVSLCRGDSIKPIIGLIGCMARNQGEEIFKRMPHVNLIVAPGKLHLIPDYIDKLQAARYRTQASTGKDGKNLNLESCSLERLRIIDLEDAEREEDFYSAHYRQDKSHAQVVISTGCSNNCAYCVVPFVRGGLRLRSPKDIIAEVKRNVALGRTKITLLGQNVNDYNYRPQAAGCRPQEKREINTKRYTLNAIRFIDLLKMVEEIEGVEEIDFLTPHPKNTSKALFRLMAKSKKIKKYLHLPFQAGSDRILKLMNRGYTKKEYLDLVKDYKTIVGGTIGTDIIVGFPTETEEDFAHTKDILEKVRFMGAYIFKYSPRPHTQALKLKDDVPLAVKEKRHAILLDLQKRISLLHR